MALDRVEGAASDSDALAVEDVEARRVVGILCPLVVCTRGEVSLGRVFCR